MENAADALKMAAAVLMFVLALSVSIVSFGQARQASDVILNYKDRETVYIDGNYYYEASGTERTVSVESIISAIYRAYSEQYKIVFQGLDDPIYTCTYTSGQVPEKRYVLDSDFDYGIITLADRQQGCKTFLHAIIYGVADSTRNPNFETWYNNRAAGKVVNLPTKSLYERLLEANSIKEYLGVYYPLETADDQTTINVDNNDDEVPEANKVEKRIITYVIE